jgi:hypothetical protein
MRARLMAGVLVALALAGAQVQAASAKDRLTTIHMGATGSITVNWHGDPAAGCAAAGMCGYSGTTDYGPAARADIERFQFGGEGFADFDGILEMRDPTTVSVRREIDGSPAAECSDHGLAPGFVLGFRSAYRGRSRVSLSTEAFPQPLGSGQCAGPRRTDVVPSLPTGIFDFDRVRRRGARLSLSGRFPLRAGPLTGEVVSTVVLHTRRTRDRRLGGGGEGTTTRRRALMVSLDYDVRSVEGSVAADFRAVASPACDAFDACGASGRDHYLVRAANRKMHVFGLASLGHRKVPKLEDAIARVTKHGFLYAFGNLGGDSGTTTTTLSRPGAADCADTFTPGGPVLDLDAGHGKIRLRLGRAGGELIGGANVLRGRCPGPTQVDMLGRAPLAGTRLSAGSLAARSIRAVLHGDGRFDGPAYTGSRRARVVVRLRRTRASVHAVEEFVEQDSVGGRSTLARRAQRP